MIVDVQFSPGTNDWPRLLDATLAAEAAGFGAAWVFDHLAGASLGGDTMFEATTLLGALAAATLSIGLGTMVANVANREPGVLLVAIASAQAIAGRPLLFGIGAGTSPASPFSAEQRAVGTAIAPLLAERHARVERTLDLIDAMWAPDRSPAMATFPLPDPRPPVLVGVNSVALATIAGRRADGINVRWSDPRRDELLGAADRARGAAPGRPWIRTVWAPWSAALLDPGDDERLGMARADVHRLVLVELGTVDPAVIAAAAPVHG